MDSMPSIMLPLEGIQGDDCDHVIMMMTMTMMVIVVWFYFTGVVSKCQGQTQAW